MLFSDRFNTFISNSNFTLIGIGIAIFYWILESFLHVLYFGGNWFTEELITPDVHEIWKRILVFSLLTLFGVFAQQYFNLRQRSENALKESEKKYRTIFEQALNPIFLLDDDGRFVDNNHATLDFLECTQQELLTKTFRDITAEPSPTKSTEKSSLIDERGIFEIDFKMGDHSKTMLLNLVALRGEAKSYIYGIGQDISEHKRMERTLKEALAELDQIFQTASVGMRVVDMNCNVVKINKTFADMTGVAESDAVNKKCYEIFSGPMCRTAGCPITRVLTGESYVETYVDKQRPDGKTIPCILTATPFTVTEGTVIGIVESFRDIAQLKEAHELIHSERDKLHRILSHLLEGVCIVNTDYIIEYQNKVLKKILGDCKGKTCYTVFREKSSPCNPCLMREAIQSGKNRNVEYKSMDGRCYEQAYTRVTDVDGKQKVVTMLKDITERKASLAAAMHSEQLAAVGELAAGVAHEINNPINGIINYAQIIKNKSEKGGVADDITGRIIKEGNRIARIVGGLLSFSRRRHEEKSIVSVKDILSDCLTLTTTQMRQDSIIFKIRLPDNLPQIMAQVLEIEQVFINIISNARYALNQKYPQPHDAKLLEITSRLAKKNHREYVRVSFLDHGTGIPANIIDKVRNPFFSTKTEGKRTGLGLSISHGIVESHEGKLTIDSIEGQFTRINVDLPVWRGKAHSRNVA
jgi:PAS domain S-box-containing protein